MMNKADSILPDSMKIFPHFLGFDLAVKEYLDDLQLELLLVYMIDQVDARALPVLAQQFDVLGNKGWNLATTEQQRRDLLKRAIELHRYKGTVWAVREALKSIGFTDVVITEHVGGHWAKFRLNIDNQDVQLGDAAFQQIIAMVEEYKNVRSYLDSVNLQISTDDIIEFELEDEAFFNERIEADDDVYMSGGLFYDGSADYDGSNDHSSDADTTTIT